MFPIESQFAPTSQMVARWGSAAQLAINPFNFELFQIRQGTIEVRLQFVCGVKAWWPFRTATVFSPGKSLSGQWICQDTEFDDGFASFEITFLKDLTQDANHVKLYIATWGSTTCNRSQHQSRQKTRKAYSWGENRGSAINGTNKLLSISFNSALPIICERLSCLLCSGAKSCKSLLMLAQMGFHLDTIIYFYPVISLIILHKINVVQYFKMGKSCTLSNYCARIIIYSIMWVILAF